MQTSRGIRNNNPGNIRHGEKWQGLAPEQTDKSFCVFVSPEYGIRALVRILQNYQKKHSLKTVPSIISRFAPPCENDTKSYINSVCAVLGVKPETEISVFEDGVMMTLLKAIIRHENGSQPYSDETLLKGMRLANG